MRMDSVREKRDSEKNDAAVTKVKLFGDALQNTAIKMSNDSIQFFLNVECLYDELNVPENFRVQLLRPYFSERTKVLLTRLDSDSAKDYGKVKEYLLHQFELSRRVFLARFKNVTRQSDAPYLVFVVAGSENGWSECDKLAIKVDTYYSNHLRDKPDVGCHGQ